MKSPLFRGILLLLFLAVTCSSASATPKVKSLCQFHYPTDYLYEWDCVRLTSKDSPWRVFGKHWQDGLRFNRMDRRHFVAGIWIKVPKRIHDIEDFTAMPAFYPEAEHEPRFIVIDQNEMFLGAYEYGKLVFSTPVAVGIDGYRLKNGYYRIDAVDPKHESSLYLMEGSNRHYPMHYALRLFVEKKGEGWTTYWLHGRDIPGYPASHGCIGLYDEEMQKQYYHEPGRPILTDAKKLYRWVLGEDGQMQHFQSVRKGPVVLLMGQPPMPAPPGDLITPEPARTPVTTPVSAPAASVPAAAVLPAVRHEQRR